MDRRFRSLIAVGDLAVALYGLVIQPWMLQWGSTIEEQTRPLPGDEFVPMRRT